MLSPSLAVQRERLLQGNAQGEVARLRTECTQRLAAAGDATGLRPGFQLPLRLLAGGRGAVARRGFSRVRAGRSPRDRRLHVAAANPDDGGRRGQSADESAVFVETAVTGTGAKADHRLAVRVQDIEELARALAAKLVRSAANSRRRPPRLSPAEAARKMGRGRRQGSCRRIAAAADLSPASGRPLPCTCWRIAINQKLGNIGQTVFFTDQIGRPNRADRLAAGAGRRHAAGSRATALGARRQPRLLGAGRLQFHRGTRTRSRCACMWASIRTKRPASATGICPRPIFWKRGAMPGPSTARRRSAAVNRAALPRAVGRRIGRFPGDTSRNAGRRNRPQALARVLEHADTRSKSEEAFDQFWKTSLHDGPSRGPVSRSRRCRWPKIGSGTSSLRRQMPPVAERRVRPRTPGVTHLSSSCRPIRPSTTALSPTTVGCRSAQSRAPS